MRAFLQNALFFAAFLALSFGFFHLALDNGFWHGDDFLSLSHNLRMTEGKLSLFDSAPPFKFQPLVYGMSYVLFHYLEFDSRGYFIVNLILHGLNSFLVYLLVYTLLRDRAISLVSGLLFVCAVGNYGKSVMVVSGLEDLVITTLALLTMIFYFTNELSHGGRTRSIWFLLAFTFFFASIFTRSTSFSLLGAFLAFGYFFRRDTGRRVLNLNFVILVVLAAGALLVKTQVFHYAPPLYTESPGPVKFVLYAAKNVLSYLVRMVFPIHTSHLVTEAGPAVRFIYQFATQIRILIALTVVSYSFFGFVFGNHTIRFFIAWTYIMVLPFAFFQFPADWLNMRNLYLVSIGFCMILSAGAVYCSRLIAHQKWRRLAPLAVPAAFILLSRFVVVQLDRSYERKAASPSAAVSRAEIVRKHPQVELVGDTFRYRASRGSTSGP